MDYQNRAGSKKGGGGVASFSETNADRRERLRKLALETIDLEKDPYFFKNHLGSFECKLCLTVHVNDGSYLAHTQGRKHQTNLARRAARDSREGRSDPITGLPIAGVPARGLIAGAPGATTVQVRQNIVKIGRPGYRITKIRDPATRQLGLRFQLQYPDIGADIVPRHRIMSAFEQRVETPMENKHFQYLLVAAEPYETVAFKIPSKEIDRRPTSFFSHYDKDTNEYFLQLLFKPDREERYSGVPGLR
ncbi:uncharacterized protein V1518DRAFT_422844 [Limtongia smithiae]|uniref:uncharacterized protein n=1 Tax=Limtongia smithiae TaxID=1125753 RepID=UPI0034CDE4FF